MPLAACGPKDSQPAHKRQCLDPRADPGFLDLARAAALGPRLLAQDHLVDESPHLVPRLGAVPRALRNPVLYPLSYEGGWN